MDVDLKNVRFVQLILKDKDTIRIPAMDVDKFFVDKKLPKTSANATVYGEVKLELLPQAARLYKQFGTVYKNKFDRLLKSSDIKQIEVFDTNGEKISNILPVWEGQRENEKQKTVHTKDGRLIVKIK